jgi:hypothetical protein
MRKLVIGGTLGVLLLSVVLVACGGAGDDPDVAEAKRAQDMWEIDQIEKNFHEATSLKDIDQMMSLYAPNATATFGPGQTVAGKDEIRAVWLKSVPFKAETNWLSDHPAYKLVATVDGDRGTLRFECHFVDMLTRKIAAVTAANQDVARIDNRWLITNFVGSTAELKR